MKFDRRTTLALFGCLLFVNFTIRIFLLGSHEEGSDSFLIHGLANTITNYGYAKWIIHPLSYFGLTPLSYPCAVPYLLSCISQLTGLDMERSILVFSIITATVGMGSAYLMAAEIKNDHVFAFLVAFTYSLAPIFVEYTLWQATTRSLFMALLPLLIWSLIRTYGNRPKKNVNIFICILIFIVLGTIHHMFLMLPLFLIAYFSSLFIYHWIRKKSLKDSWIYRHQTLIIFAIFLTLIIPQFTHISIYSTVSWQKYQTGLFFTGTGREIIFTNMIIDYWSRTGIFAFFGLMGLFALIYRPRRKFGNAIQRYKFDKTQGEIFIIFGLFMTIPFVTMGVYVSLIFLPFFSIIIGYSIARFIKLFRKSKFALRAFISIFIVMSLAFTGFMNIHWSNSITSQPMSDQSYATGIYIKYNFKNSSISNNGLIGNRVASISENPCLPLGGANAQWYPPELLIYEFTDVDDYTFSRISFDAVILTQSDYLYTTTYGVNAKDDWVTMMGSPFDGKQNYQLYNRYKVENAIEYLPQEGQYYFWDARGSPFLVSLHTTKYVAYDNGEIRVWLLD
jgi:hypothetical protein